MNAIIWSIIFCEDAIQVQQIYRTPQFYVGKAAVIVDKVFKKSGNLI